MHLESTIMFYNYLDSLQEPFRFIIFLLICAGVPILCIVMWYLGTVVDNRKARKNLQEIKK